MGRTGWRDTGVYEHVGLYRKHFTGNKKGFPAFLEKGLQENPMKCEYFLPSVVSELIESEKAIVTVLESEDKWYGVTYREDKPLVMNAIEKLKDEGIYPQHLWKD